jgi:hypothetical protein
MERETGAEADSRRFRSRNGQPIPNWIAVDRALEANR